MPSNPFTPQEYAAKLHELVDEFIGQAPASRLFQRVSQLEPSLRRTIVMAPKGHFTSHFLQPVQASTSLITADFRQSFSSRLSRCKGQAATHQPHPVQRDASILGINALSWVGISVLIASSWVVVAFVRLDEPKGSLCCGILKVHVLGATFELALRCPRFSP